MKKFYCIIRYGILNLKGTNPSNVQCAGVNHPIYSYGVGVLYESDITLDENGWLIDNNEIDALMQQTVADSCERMLEAMLNAAVARLVKAGIPFRGVKVLLKPGVVVDEKVAEFSLCSVVDDIFLKEVLSINIAIPD